MKKSKWLALAGVSLLSVGVLVACSSKSNTSSNTYNYVYTADPETLDYLISNKGSTTDAVTNGVDGLTNFVRELNGILQMVKSMRK